MTPLVQITFSGLTEQPPPHTSTACVTGNAGVATTTPTFTGFVRCHEWYDVISVWRAVSIPFIPGSQWRHSGRCRGGAVQRLIAGQAYVNIHTTAYGSGEIRAFSAEPTGGDRSRGLLGGGASG